MNIVCIASDQYPDKYAAPIRHSTLARGLAELGHTVTFLLLSYQNWPGEDTLHYQGVVYRQMNDYKGSNKLLKKYHALKAISRVKKWITQQAADGKLDAVMVYTVETLPVSQITRHAKKCGIKVFHERTELPYVSAGERGRGNAAVNFYLNKLLPRFDGIFAINDKLKSFIEKYNPHTKKLLTVVNLSFFKTDKPNPYPFDYIGYCGQIWGQKDGVPILIEAFAKISARFPGIKLVLVGDNSKKDLIKDTTDSIEKFGLTDKVFFTGLVEREMMPVILSNARILVVAKPDTERNSGNFPIKIGEYLATGVPVVVTAVGEIPLFIKDGESGFLAAPGSADAFAEKMSEALTDTARATAAGKRGREVAVNNFDYTIQAKIMADYISEICNKK